MFANVLFMYLIKKHPSKENTLTSQSGCFKDLEITMTTVMSQTENSCLTKSKERIIYNS